MVKPQTAGAPWQAIVDSRAVLTAVQGLGSRFHQVVSPRAAAQTTGWRLAAALGATVDVAKAHVLARDDRFRLGSRLLLDAADLALWCVAAGDDTDTSEDAVIPGAALATEAGARLGPIGLAVPVANAAVAAAVRRARGHRLGSSSSRGSSWGPAVVGRSRCSPSDAGDGWTPSTRPTWLPAPNRPSWRGSTT
jgi:hypothetical protein